MPYKLQKQTIKLLGISLGRDKQQTNNDNVDNKLANISKTLDRWSQRRLSLLGKILVTKTHAVAKIVHVMSITTMSKDQLTALQRLLTRFIWSKKPPKVKHSVMIAPQNEGGIKALDVVSQYKALRLPWIWRLIRSSNWNATINMKLSQVGGISLLIQCNFDKGTINFLPQFYKEMFIYWQEIVEHLGVDELIVWNNKNIKIANKTIFIEELYQHNVVYIHDFFQNRIILPYENFCNIYQIRISRKLYLKVTKAIQKFVNRDQHIQAILDQAKPTHIRNKTRFRLLSGTWIDLRTAKSKHFYNEFLIFKTGFASALTQW